MKTRAEANKEREKERKSLSSKRVIVPISSLTVLRKRERVVRARVRPKLKVKKEILSGPRIPTTADPQNSTTAVVEHDFVSCSS